MKNLLCDYSPLQFNNVVGLTCHRDVGDTRSALCLKNGVIRWCAENLSQEPFLKCYRNWRWLGKTVPGEVWLHFADEEDRMLFKLRFAHHFMPGAINFLPFGNELDD